MNWSAFGKKTDNCQFFKANSAFNIFSLRKKLSFNYLKLWKSFKQGKKNQPKPTPRSKSNREWEVFISSIKESGFYPGDQLWWSEKLGIIMSTCLLYLFTTSRSKYSTCKGREQRHSQAPSDEISSWNSNSQSNSVMPRCKIPSWLSVCCPCPFPEPQHSPGLGTEGVNDKKKFIMCSHCSLSAGISEAAFDKMAGAKFSMCRLEVKCN